MRSLLLLALTVALTSSAVDFAIDGQRRHQTIDGFGANINSLSFTNANSRAAIDQLADQMGQTLWRVVFDMMDWEATNDNADPLVADQPFYAALYSNAKFQNLWGTLRYLNQKGFDSTIALSFMGPTSPWMGGATVTQAHEEEVVEAIVTLVTYARNTEHVRFGMLDPFNESDWNGNEGPQLSATQYTRLLSRLITRLDAAGISDLRLLGPNTASLSTGVQTYLPAMMANATVMGRVDHFGVHDYSASASSVAPAIAASNYSSRNFWVTEYAAPEHAFALLQQGASALIVWEGFDSIYNHAIARGEPAVPGNDDVGSVPLQYRATTPVSYTPRKEFYKDAQLFKFVPPGAVRVDATSSSGNVDVVAFHHLASGRVTIVALNKGSATTVNGSLRNLPTIGTFSYVKTDSASNLAQGADVAVTAGAFSFAIPSGAIVTLTGLAVAVDAGALDAGPPDAGRDAGSVDGGALDAGPADAGRDAGSGHDDRDAGALDDAGASDAGLELDGGATGAGAAGGCGCGGGPLVAWLGVVFAFRRRLMLSGE